MIRWKEWVINLDFPTQPCYAPIENDEVQIEMTIVGKCPGELVGLYSEDEEKVRQFINDNPEWQQ